VLPVSDEVDGYRQHSTRRSWDKAAPLGGLHARMKRTAPRQTNSENACDTCVRPRIALFQASWPLQIHTVNLAKALVGFGYRVDLYLHDVGFSYVDIGLVAEPGLTIHAWAAPPSAVADCGPARGASQRARRALKRVRILRWLVRTAKHHSRETQEWLLLCLRSRRGLIPSEALSQASASVEAAPHVALVGVEKLGLIWAAEVSRATGVPFAYYSLELYTREHPVSTRSARVRRIKWFEALSHRAAAGTIIQDELRARVLLADNGVTATQLMLLPVSVPGPARASRTRYLHELLSLQDGAKVVLQLGQIVEGRLSVALARTAQSFPPACVLVMHGPGDPSSLAAVAEADGDDRVALSPELVSEGRLPELVASADVGLVFYSDEFVNDRLTARSSEKLARFLRSGVPVVAFAYPGYEVLRDYECGVLIDDLLELPVAVATILARRQIFSENALRCFADLYDSARFMPSVAEALGHLSS